MTATFPEYYHTAPLTIKTADPQAKYLTLNPALTIGVPMLDGSLKEIKHLPFNKVIKALGSMTCPSRSSAAALDRMQQQGQEWVDKVLASMLSRQNLWFVTNCQFWPWLGY
jgi:hypothetical protein